MYIKFSSCIDVVEACPPPPPKKKQNRFAGHPRGGKPHARPTVARGAGGGVERLALATMSMRKSILTTRLLRREAQRVATCDDARALALQALILRETGESCNVECVRAYFRDRTYRLSRAEGALNSRRVKSIADKAWLERLWVAHAGKCPRRDDEEVQMELQRRRVTFQDVQQWFGQRRFKQNVRLKLSTQEKHRRAHIFVPKPPSRSPASLVTPPQWSLGDRGARSLSGPPSVRSVRNARATFLIAYNETTRLARGDIVTTAADRCATTDPLFLNAIRLSATCAWRGACQSECAPARDSSCTQSVSSV